MFDRLKEYVKLLPSALSNIDNVAEGAVNAMLFSFKKLPEDEMNEIARRREICKMCPFMSENAIKNPAINYKSSRAEDHCIMCGCPIATKTASLNSNCGIEKFNEQSLTKMELKWTEYKPTNNEQAI